MTHRL